MVETPLYPGPPEVRSKISPRCLEDSASPRASPGLRISVLWNSQAQMSGIPLVSAFQRLSEQQHIDRSRREKFQDKSRLVWLSASILRFNHFIPTPGLSVTAEVKEKMLIQCLILLLFQQRILMKHRSLGNAEDKHTFGENFKMSNTKIQTDFFFQFFTDLAKAESQLSCLNLDNWEFRQEVEPLVRALVSISTRQA